MPRTLGVAAIIIALVGGLSAGLIVPSLVHGTPTSTATSIFTETVYATSTVFGGGGGSTTATVTQALRDTRTDTLVQNQTETQTQPVTKYLTSFTNNFVTVTQLVTTTATTYSNASVTFYHNYRYVYPSNQPAIALQTFEFTGIGYIEVAFQSAQKIHWQLTSYDLIETTPSNTTVDIIEFPVAPAQSYTLSIVNDGCGATGCGSSFDVNMTLVYYN